jgi:hypothetical protein
MSALADAVVSGWRAAYGFRNNDARELANALLSTDPLRRAYTINRMSQVYGARQVRRAQMHANAVMRDSLLGVGGAKIASDYVTGPDQEQTNALALPQRNVNALGQSVYSGARSPSQNALAR